MFGNLYSSKLRTHEQLSSWVVCFYYPLNLSNTLSISSTEFVIAIPNNI